MEIQSISTSILRFACQWLNLTAPFILAVGTSIRTEKAAYQSKMTTTRHFRIRRQCCGLCGPRGYIRIHPSATVVRFRCSMSPDSPGIYLATDVRCCTAYATCWSCMLDCYSPVHEVSAKLMHEPTNFLVRFPLLAFVRPAEPLAGTASRILPSSGFTWADHVDSAGLSRLSETSVAEFSLQPYVGSFML
jgi:hypothetical protein